MTEEINFIIDSAKESMNGSVAHLEKESAWQRKQVNLDNNSTTPSTDSQVSRYTLGENNEIRPNNSFLHDNVD